MIERTLARVTDRIIVVSRQQQKEINETYSVGRKEQFLVIPLGLDLTQFNSSSQRARSCREQLGIPQELIVGIVGRLTEIKNHKLFLRAVELFKQKALGQQVRFVVLGDGHLRQALEEQTREAGLEADVIFAGTRNDPENFYPALDVVALTSLNEGTPLTLLEAMANARPVIATAVGGVVDLLGEVREETQDAYQVCRRGLSVVPGDAHGFATGLQRLVEDEKLRNQLAEQGLQFVGQSHSKERLMKDMNSLYSELMKTLNCRKSLDSRARLSVG
jgi:glycosyltransferase involved in cell wall biosynthesis